MTNVEWPAPEAVEVLGRCTVAAILDELGRTGAMAAEIKPLAPGMQLCGPAVTCLGPDLDLRRMAIDLAPPGSVLVLAVEGITDRACFGSYTAEMMQRSGLAGVVIDGATRDVAEIRRLGFPTFARAATPRRFAYPQAVTEGAVNVAVACGGTLVSPGDVVVGDDDGVIVVPRERSEALGPAVLESVAAERRKWEARFGKPFGVEDRLRARGFVFE